MYCNIDPADYTYLDRYPQHLGNSLLKVSWIVPLYFACAPCLRRSGTHKMRNRKSCRCLLENAASPLLTALLLRIMSLASLPIFSTDLTQSASTFNITNDTRNNRQVASQYGTLVLMRITLSPFIRTPFAPSRWPNQRTLFEQATGMFRMMGKIQHQTPRS